MIMPAEEDLLTRAEMLEDTGDLAAQISEVLTGASRAGTDPQAVASLIAAVGILDPGAAPGYDPGTRHDRDRGGGYRSDAEMLEAVSEAENDIRERLREVRQLQERAGSALDAAEKALAAARAMPVRDECDGCHRHRDAAIAAAQKRMKACEAAGDILGPLAGRLAAAVDRLRQVPHDLGEVYELVYAFIRKGGKLPDCARWIEGARA
jgi:hypothetical protein